MKDALQGDCTCYAPGIEIMSVRITKPIIPERIRCNFGQMEEECTKVQFLFLEYERLSFYFHRKKKKNVLLHFFKNFPQLVKQSK